jgi:hypothetical protein
VKKHERKSTLVLKWNHASYYISFKEFPKGLDQATLRDLKVKCKMVTGVPVATMRLKVSGGNALYSTLPIVIASTINKCYETANMKEESATLSSYGVHSNSIIQLDGKSLGVSFYVYRSRNL